MELFYLYTLLFTVLVTLISHQLLHLRRKVTGVQPQGRTGWPLIGESLEYLSTGWNGRPEKFVLDRMARFSRSCFKTSILGEKVAVMCGAEGNKFLFSKEEKLVVAWWPRAFDKVFPTPVGSKDEGKKLRRMLPLFLKPDKLQRYVGIMDCVARRHFDESWNDRHELLVFPLSKKYTFRLACKVFMSLDNPTQIERFAGPFGCLASGLLGIPIDLPGTPFNKAIKASRFIRKELKLVIKQRKLDLAVNKASPTQDILSHMLTTPIDGELGEESYFMTEDDIANKIIGLLIGGYDTGSAAITFVVKFMAELPHVYEKV